MKEIQITKIDGQEFVPYKDYLRLKEEKENLKSDLEKFSEAYKRYRDYEKEELAESCYDLERENKKLKEKLEKIKETYIRFEDSEKEYNKGLGELDQLIMNR